MKKFLLLFALTILWQYSYPQGYYTMGSHTSSTFTQPTQFLPVAFTRAKVQFLFTNAELIEAGIVQNSEILGVEWYVATDNTPGTATFDLSMSDDYVNPGSGLPADGLFADLPFTSVGTGITDEGTLNGWHTAMFSSGFSWDGTDDLVLQLCRPANSLPDDDLIGVYSGNTGVNLMISGYNHACSATSGYYSRKERPYIRLIVKVPAVADFTASLTRCEGEEITFTDESKGLPTTYSWDFTGGSPSTSDAANPEVVYSSPGTYTVTLTVSNAYSSDVETKTDFITINSLPNVSITEPSSTTFCIGDDAITLSASPALGTFSGNGISGNMFDPFSAGAGVHSIVYEYTDGHGCSNSDDIDLTVDICTGLRNNQASQSAVVYPNPGSNEISIQLPHEWTGNVSIQIVQPNGKALMSFQKTASGNHTVNCNMEQLDSGIYVLVLENEEREKVFARWVKI